MTNVRFQSTSKETRDVAILLILMQMYQSMAHHRDTIPGLKRRRYTVKIEKEISDRFLRLTSEQKSAVSSLWQPYPFDRAWRDWQAAQIEVNHCDKRLLLLISQALPNPNYYYENESIHPELLKLVSEIEI
jgi:hypothetical protein